MYLHLGQNTVVRGDRIIGIFDMDNASVAKTTRSYLGYAQKRGRIVDISGELPKSFVVCAEEEGIRVYLSQISPATLKKRAGDYPDLGV